VPIRACLAAESTINHYSGTELGLAESPSAQSSATPTTKPLPY
jgi:hypothetical protein